MYHRSCDGTVRTDNSEDGECHNKQSDKFYTIPVFLLEASKVFSESWLSVNVMTSSLLIVQTNSKSAVGSQTISLEVPNTESYRSPLSTTLQNEFTQLKGRDQANYGPT